VSSFLIVTQQRDTLYNGTLDVLENAARSTFRHNLLFGWWGFPFGLIWTPMALWQNARAIRQVRALETTQPTAGPSHASRPG
jgi:hypothetical protein